VYGSLPRGQSSPINSGEGLLLAWDGQGKLGRIRVRCFGAERSKDQSMPKRKK